MKNKDLQDWIEVNAESVGAETTTRALNLLPDEEEVANFLKVLVAALVEGPGGRLRVVQSWASNHVGNDAVLANDWLAILRTIKEVVGDQLPVEFAAAESIAYFRECDRIISLALIEVSRLTGDNDRIQLLEHMVELRRRMARLDHNKASFIKVAAHELRTPLTLLEGYASMMRAMNSPDLGQLKMMLDGFDGGIARLRNVIGDMIDVTMIDADAIDIHFQPVYLEKVIHVVAENAREAFEERQVALTITPFLLRDPIYADPERLYQAFSHIVTNSLKYTPDGGRVVVTSHLVRTSDRRAEIAGHIRIEVQDTGIGIDPENLERIFEIFSGIQDFSLHSSGKTKFKGGGAGLGLPIVRGIIEAHGGRVWAESVGFDEFNCPGSTFHIELPIRTQPPGA